jgi:metal-responsive CopG/Arc/MetJ family transcriptional regulator
MHTMALTRTNVTIPAELLRQMDELAGPRGRSAFVADAIAARVKRERLRRALDGLKGVYVGTTFWMPPDEAYRWVRDQREDPEDEAAT